MRLQGSCHCGAVRFELDCPHPYPFNLCYCSICAKTNGSGGFGINIGGRYDTLKILSGESNISVYRAMMTDAKSGEQAPGPAERHFCKTCSSGLWLWDPRWPELVHPFAAAIDSDLPTPPRRTHMMMGSKAAWVSPFIRRGDMAFDEYPHESLAEWHRRHGLER